MIILRLLAILVTVSTALSGSTNKSKDAAVPHSTNSIQEECDSCYNSMHNFLRLCESNSGTVSGKYANCVEQAIAGATSGKMPQCKTCYLAQAHVGHTMRRSKPHEEIGIPTSRPKPSGKIGIPTSRPHTFQEQKQPPSTPPPHSLPHPQPTPGESPNPGGPIKDHKVKLEETRGPHDWPGDGYHPNVPGQMHPLTAKLAA